MGSISHDDARSLGSRVQDRYSRRRISAFARAVGGTPAEYFDPLIASFDAYRDVIAPAVFAIVPGQKKLTEALTAAAFQQLPLLHGIHIELKHALVAGAHLQTTVMPLDLKLTGPISAASAVCRINSDDGDPIAVVTQKLALVSATQRAQSVDSPRAAPANSTDPTQLANPANLVGEFELPLNPQQLKTYMTVSDDLNPIHSDPAYAHGYGYPDPLAQGMLVLGLAISALEDEIGHYLLPQQIQARFFQPMPVPPEGMTVIVQITEQNDGYHLAFHQGGQRVARATLTGTVAG